MRTLTTMLCLLALAACDRSGDDSVGPPAALEVTLPASPAAVDDLVAGVEAVGLGKAEVRFAWSVDGKATAHDGDTVPASELEIGQTWTVTATVKRNGETLKSSQTTRVDRLGGNVLVLLVDDLGIDRVAAYGEGSNMPPTPTIDGLAADGVLFRNAWVQPTCSPTRASLLTGRYPRRTGVGRWIMPPDQRLGIDPDEVMIPEMLAHAPVRYTDAGVGKWHLSGYKDATDPGMDPLTAGFSWFAGTLGNPDNSFLPAGGNTKGYGYYEKTVNGALDFQTHYLTSDTTDDALERIGAMPEPWVLWVAYHAPHSPLHIPPPHLHGYDLDPGTASTYDKYDAMVEALDTEMGRLLDGLSSDVAERTTVIFLSDNGTPEHGIRPPNDPDRKKGTVYEGGVNVPMIVTGPAVRQRGTETEALVESVDLFQTVAEIAGVDTADVLDPRTGQPVVLDGVSFLAHVRDPDAPSTRTLAYTSKHFPNGPGPYTWTQDALRDDRYKVAYHSDGSFWFFEFQAPFDEGPELLGLGPLEPEQQAAFDRLSGDLLDQVEGLQFGP